MSNKDHKANNRIRTITTTHYLTVDPEDIVIDCDTGRGKEFIGSLWDSLIKDNYQYTAIPGKPRALVKETEYERGSVIFHFVDRFILPI
ncbi:hypothetical protein AGMMS49579_17660 [Spirochaetia bacterium]|nr:hypothetical protein AGMMS49579_17660 [Spirochaetia bacterium]